MKRWFAMVAAVTAAVLLAALCIPLLRSAGPAQTTEPEISGTTGSRPTGTEPATDPQETYSYTVNIQRVPETVENPDGLPVLSLVSLAHNPGIRILSEDLVTEANQMLADKNMPFRLQITYVTYERPKAWVSYDPIPEINLFTRPETKEILENADIISTDFKDGELEAYLSPITEYVSGDAQPSLANAVPSRMDWSWTTVGKEIYGVPTMHHQVQSVGWHIDGAFWSQYGLKVEDFSRPYWEMDDVFAEIYAQNGGEPFLCINDAHLFNPYCEAVSGDGDVHTSYPGALNGAVPMYYQPIGGVFAIDHSAEIPTVVNLLETETIQKIWQAMIRYQKAGYAVCADWLEFMPVQFDTTVGTEVYTDKHPIYTEYNGDICIPVGASVCRKYYIADHPAAGIAAESKHKELAVSLLKLIGEDEQFRMQLCYGKEGRDYEFVDGDISLIDKEVVRLSSVSIFSDFLSWSTMLNVHEGKTRLETYIDNLNGVTLRDYPITFDYTGFEKFLSSLKSMTRSTYFTGFTQHEATDKCPAMTEQRYAEMLQQLRDIGCEELRQELQRQLDAWLAENPDWLSQYG